MMLNASIMTVEKLGRTMAARSDGAIARSAPNKPPKPRNPLPGLPGSAASGSSVSFGAMAGDGGAAGEAIGVEVDCDDDARAEGARRRDRDRVDQRAIDQPTPAKPDRRENSGKRIGGAQRQRERAPRQPDFMAGADLGRDRRETHWQIFDRRVADRLFEPSREAAAADQAGTADPDVEIAEDAAQRQGARPALQLIELAVRIATADQRAHRGADDDVGKDAVLAEGMDDADVGEAARRAAAEDEPDRWPRAAFGNNGPSPDVYDTHFTLTLFPAKRPVRRRAPVRDHCMIGQGKNRNKLVALLW